MLLCESMGIQRQFRNERCHLATSSLLLLAYSSADITTGMHWPQVSRTVRRGGA